MGTCPIYQGEGAVAEQRTCGAAVQCRRRPRMMRRECSPPTRAAAWVKPRPRPQPAVPPARRAARKRPVRAAASSAARQPPWRRATPTAAAAVPPRTAPNDSALTGGARRRPARTRQPRPPRVLASMPPPRGSRQARGARAPRAPGGGRPRAVEAGRSRRSGPAPSQQMRGADRRRNHSAREEAVLRCRRRRENASSWAAGWARPSNAAVKSRQYGARQ